MHDIFIYVWSVSSSHTASKCTPSCGSKVTLVFNSANLDWLGFGNHTGGGVLRWPPCPAAVWQCAVANHDARFSPSLEMPGLPTPTVVVTNMPHGRYLQLPYKGYLREIICTLASTAPAARFGFFHAAGDLQDDGPDNLARVRRPGTRPWLLAKP